MPKTTSAKKAARTRKPRFPDALDQELSRRDAPPLQLPPSAKPAIQVTVLEEEQVKALMAALSTQGCPQYVAQPTEPKSPPAPELANNLAGLQDQHSNALWELEHRIDSLNSRLGPVLKSAETTRESPLPLLPEDASPMAHYFRDRLGHTNFLIAKVNNILSRLDLPEDNRDKRTAKTLTDD